MSNSSQRELWQFFGGLTVLLLILSSGVQRQLQSFHGADGSSQWPEENTRVRWRAYVVGEDFPIYYVAGKVAVSDGDRTLYYPAADGGRLSFRNLLDTIPRESEWGRVAAASGFPATGRFMAPPFTALLAAPLTMLPPRVALLFWRVISILALTVALYFTCVLLGGDWRVSGFFVAAIAAAFSFFPFIETLYQGQVDALVLLLWVLGVYFVQTDSPYSSAFCFAVATMIKASPILVVGLFLLRRQWKWVAAYTTWMGVFVIIGVWQLGWQNHIFWFNRMLPILSGGVPFFASKSLPSFVTELYLRRVPLDVSSIPYLPAVLGWLNKALSLLLYCGTLYYFWHRSRSAKNLVYELMVLSLVILLASPESFRHHYLLAALPLLYLWSRSQEWFGDYLVLRFLALGAATLVIGTPFADYVITSVRNPGIDLLLTGLYPAATIVLMWLASEAPVSDERLHALTPALSSHEAA